MKEKNTLIPQLKFLRIDPFYEMGIKGIDISHQDLDKTSTSEESFYELQDYLMTYSFVAKMGDQILGYCLLTILPTQYGFDRVLVIDHLKVGKTFENKGIAQKMFSQIKKIARNTESTGIVMHCNFKTPITEHLLKKWDLEPINSLLFKSKILA